MCDLVAENAAPCHLRAMLHPAFDTVAQDFPGPIHRLRHRASGAEVVVLQDGRPENCTSISFATPACDDTGAGHVLEHLIFRGSAGFPDDQLYARLRAGSLASHLNAATRGSVTSYHLASPVAADLLRSEVVLWDAVFHPLLRADAFTEEAHSIVLSEMTGHLSGPAARLEQGLRRGLFPRAPEGRVYGGDPACLPGLSLAAVQRFHRQFYRPDTALVIFTGTAALTPRLEGLHHACLAALRPKPNPQREAPPEGPTAVRTAAPELGAFGRGWRLDGAPPARRAVVAALLVQAAGPGLWPASGLVEDSRLPYLLLMAPHKLEVDPAKVAADLTPERLQLALRAIRLRHADEGADFRLPAGLQGRAAMLGGWLQQGDPLAPLSEAAALAWASHEASGLLMDLRGDLLRLAANDAVEVPLAPPPPRDGPPLAKDRAGRAGLRFAAPFAA